jgi:hypothetical protein
LENESKWHLFVFISRSSVISIMRLIKTYADLYQIQRILKFKLNDCDVLFKELIKKVKTYSQEDLNELRQNVSSYCVNVSKRWRDSTRCHKKFLATNEKWLQTKVKLPVNAKSTTVLNKPGPKLKDFEFGKKLFSIIFLP